MKGKEFLDFIQSNINDDTEIEAIAVGIVIDGDFKNENNAMIALEGKATTLKLIIESMNKSLKKEYKAN